MSLEKEFLYYSNLLQNKTSNESTCDNRPVSQTLSEEDNSFYINTDNYTYLNIKLVLTSELLEEINVVSQSLGTTPEETLINYIQYADDINLLPIRPLEPIEEDLNYDAMYLIDISEDEDFDN